MTHLRTLHKIYRISDAGNTKQKLTNGGKFNCFINFIREFGTDDVYIFADNCKDETLDFLKKYPVKIFETSVGASGSFKNILNFAIKYFKNEDYVYFVEDDYLHLNGSKNILLEGLSIADYVTLYDHPDKYGITTDKNPFVVNGGETSSVFLSRSAHWKTTNSTPLTFAANIVTLKKDINIFYRYCSAKGTWSFGIFSTLTKQPFIPMLLSGSYYFVTFWRFIYLFIPRKKRILISPIPGYSTHTELKYLSPNTDWSLI